MSTAQAVIDKTTKRDQVLYAWVKKVNKKFVEGLADKGGGSSISVVVDDLLDRIREEHENGRKRRQPSKRVS